ncbi:MAG: cupin-like domain-containing protein [Nostoc sp.]|uniref:cupin-like domain-containing protein n=1 Tax=Nostoc sp. TaxID=1180 RepID=UPI002FF63447
MTIQSPIYLSNLILFSLMLVTLFFSTRLIIYVLKRMWRKNKYKLIWTPISSVERRSNLSYEEFVRDYANIGKPVIITDSMKNWKAMTKWTIDFFRSEYSSTNFLVTDVRNQTQVDMTVAQYLDQMSADACDNFLYLRSLRISSNPKLYEDYKIPVYFPDWLQKLPQKLLIKYRLDLYDLYIGGKDTSIGLHSDILDSPAWVALIDGRKKIVLFTPDLIPDQKDILSYGKDETFNGDVENFPLYANANPVEVILEPGEIIYIPPKWWHHVKNLENSISMNANMINEWSSEIVYSCINQEYSTKGKILPLILEFPWLGRALFAMGLL